MTVFKSGFWTLPLRREEFVPYVSLNIHCTVPTEASRKGYTCTCSPSPLSLIEAQASVAREMLYSYMHRGIWQRGRARSLFVLLSYSGPIPKRRRRRRRIRGGEGGDVGNRAEEEGTHHTCSHRRYRRPPHPLRCTHIPPGKHASIHRGGGHIVRGTCFLQSTVPVIRLHLTGQVMGSRMRKTASASAKASIQTPAFPNPPSLLPPFSCLPPPFSFIPCVDTLSSFQPSPSPIQSHSHGEREGKEGPSFLFLRERTEGPKVYLRETKRKGEKERGALSFGRQKQLSFRSVGSGRGGEGVR